MSINPNLIRRDWAAVTKEIDPDHPDRLIFKFATYGWSFPSQFANGMHKNGITYRIERPGEQRMREACSGKKTSIPEQPFVIPGSEIVWEVPYEISQGLLAEANRFARKFDVLCNKALSPYKTKLSGQELVGEEWYRLTPEKVREIRISVWEKMVPLEIRKLQRLRAAPRSRISLKKGPQEEALQLVLDKISHGTRRFKGIAPTGFGKTVLAWQCFIQAYGRGLLSGRISIMTAPSQFLCNKNAKAFDDYNRRNGITWQINQPIFSGSDVGVFETENQLESRRERLKDQIAGHLLGTGRIVLHVCLNSMRLVREVLDSLDIREIDLMIVDEAHTLASYKNNSDPEYRGTIRNFALFEENFEVGHRFFLTATEKNLVNPEDLSDNQIWAYMNNDELFGEYAFQYSYAQCVVAGLIVPFRCKVFEYSTRQAEVARLIGRGVMRFMLDDLLLTDPDGDRAAISLRLIRTLVSTLKIIEERRKLLIIVSRNSQADLLRRSLEMLQEGEGWEWLREVNIHSITADVYKRPESRHEELEIIHESEEKHIVICGPWAITGVDCPSIDAILWGFTPGTEITAAQGTGRGTRTHEGKEDLLVCFNLDMDLQWAEIRDSLVRAISKLYEGLFPSHDLELRQRMVRLLGRTFLERERDEEATPPPDIVSNLMEFFEAANGIDLYNFIESRSFLGGGQVEYYTFEELQEIAAESSAETVSEFYETIVPQLKDPRIPAFNYLRNWNPEYARKYKELGPSSFIGKQQSEKRKEELFDRMNEFVEDCQRNNFSLNFARQEINKEFDRYCPFIRGPIKDGKKIYLDNPLYEPKVYDGLKKGFPFSPTRSGLILQFEEKFGKVDDRLQPYLNELQFRNFIALHRVSNLLDYKKLYSELGEQYFFKAGLPSPKLFSTPIMWKRSRITFDPYILPRKEKFKKWDFNKTKKIHEELLEGMENPSFEIQTLIDREKVDHRFMNDMFKQHKLSKIKNVPKHQRIRKELLMEKLQKGLNQKQIADELKTNPTLVRRALNYHKLI